MCDNSKNEIEFTEQEIELILSSIKYLEAEFGEDELMKSLKEKLHEKLSK